MGNDTLKLAHSKPLAFIKIQTTGLNSATDRIIELSITKIGTDGKKVSGDRLINPEIQISDEVTKINGITNEMVKDKKTFKEIAENMNKFLEGCDFVGFNINRFDLKFLTEEFNRVGIEFTVVGRKVVDLVNIYHSMEPRDLASAYSLYCEKTVESHISSQKITEMYFEIFNGMMDKYQDKEYIDKDGITHKITPTVEAINEAFNKNKKQLDIDGNIILNEAGRPIFNVGKHKGKIVSEALKGDTTYYDWIINVSNFAADTKLIIKRIVAKAEAANAVVK